MNYFRGSPYQRGHGLARFFGNLGKSVLPIVSGIGRRTLKTVGKTALKIGTRIAKDVFKGRELKKSASKRAHQAGTDLIDMGLTSNKRPKFSAKRTKLSES